MAVPLKLNRRQKVALFLTLVLAGIAALSGAEMMEVVGIFLFGFAFAWAFGSDSRVFHWLFLSIGIVIACAPISSWFLQQHYDLQEVLITDYWAPFGNSLYDRHPLEPRWL